MLLPHLLALTLVLAPLLASAAIFPKGTHVKMLDAKGFKKAMKRNVWPPSYSPPLDPAYPKTLGNKRRRVRRAMVWCESLHPRFALTYPSVCRVQHCQNMAPEYSKAAKSLHPMVPLYAVDCDAEPNKRLCGEQVRACVNVLMRSLQ